VLIEDETMPVEAYVFIDTVNPRSAAGRAGLPIDSADGRGITRVEVDGQPIEIAAEGLFSDAPARRTEMLPYPRGVLTVDSLLNQLVDQVRRGPSEAYAEQLPAFPSHGTAADK
jgi:hypothetical protein